jgi:hypothetical protein
MRILRNIVWSSWGILAMFLIVLFSVPKLVLKTLGPAGPDLIETLFLWTVISTGIYKVLFLFKAGMKRS